MSTLSFIIEVNLQFNLWRNLDEIIIKNDID